MKLHHHSDHLELNHEINVTPFIDVILVLLIIFMVAAPLATVDVPIDLPVSRATAQQHSDDPLIVSLGKDGKIAIGNDAIARSALGARLIDRAKGDRDARIFLRADKAVSYGDIMSLMDDLRSAGFLKVALVGADQEGAGS